MFFYRVQPATICSQRRALAWLLAFCSLLGFLLPGTAAQAHDHGHRHTPPMRAEAAMISHASENAPGDEAWLAGDGHGHHHSGDPLNDLLTLGHNHVGGSCPGLPPTLWILAAAPQATDPIAPWPERTLGDSPPDSPFRPPIA